MDINAKDILTVTFTLFAIIDIIGSIPVLISLKRKIGGIREGRATIISGALMILFLFLAIAVVPRIPIFQAFVRSLL